MSTQGIKLWELEEVRDELKRFQETMAAAGEVLNSVMARHQFVETGDRSFYQLWSELMGARGRLGFVGGRQLKIVEECLRDVSDKIDNHPDREDPGPLFPQAKAKISA